MHVKRNPRAGGAGARGDDVLGKNEIPLARRPKSFQWVPPSDAAAAFRGCGGSSAIVGAQSSVTTMPPAESFGVPLETIRRALRRDAPEARRAGRLAKRSA